MSYFDRQQQPAPRPRPKNPAARDWAAKPLTPHQKSTLAILAKDAYQVHSRAGLCDSDEQTFRRAQVAIATGKPGLRECRNSDFRAIKAHLLRLLGRDAEADAVWKTTGRVKGSDEIGDTHENREAAKVLLRDLVKLSGGTITDAYVAAVATDQFPEFREAGLDGLRATHLQRLVFVITQRSRRKSPPLH